MKEVIAIFFIGVVVWLFWGIVKASLKESKLYRNFNIHPTHDMVRMDAFSFHCVKCSKTTQGDLTKGCGK